MNRGTRADVIAVIGLAGAGRDTVAGMLAERFPGYAIASISEPLLRDYERRHGMTANALDDYDAKALRGLARQRSCSQPTRLGSSTAPCVIHARSS
ncbi:hypothetical protein [Amycolatopsis decaplanina]|uniref:Uncharacterized protein n=1 Tax=Amycolatopsis decaplanina DSM 44594 TaxID=1284240 RepID=M2YSD1_9PSEU|nr:hypothetical protein [Amycolatopsis decaplanina]EME51688.1 hypothetical protein H074_35924 [Amycolatopsis decaplanina DSM 44594]